MSTVETETHGQTLVVRMNRPKSLNALNHEMRTELSEVWNDFRESNDLEVAIFTGAGRGFCAGEDMKESLQDGAPGGRKPARPDPFMDGTLEKPVIAAINGTAVGGGLTPTFAADIRICSSTAKLGMVFARRGIVPEAASAYFLPKLVGVAKALEWCMTGRVFPATEAEGTGLFNYLLPYLPPPPTSVPIFAHSLLLSSCCALATVRRRSTRKRSRLRRRSWRTARRPLSRSPSSCCGSS